MSNDLMSEFLKRNRNKTLSIHCVGDAMVDEYKEVKISRISPEFPGAIMKATTPPVKKPGGVANVAYQFKHFNVKPVLFCLHDPMAEEVFMEHGLRLLPRASRLEPAKLPVKRRYVDNGIQVAPREDTEYPLCGLTPEGIDQHVGMSGCVPYLPVDVAIFSDYDKGFFSTSEDLLDTYRHAKWRIVDPKNGPLEKWSQATIVKPNALEAERLTSETDWRRQCDVIVQKTGCYGVVITQGNQGVVGWATTGYFEYRPDFQVDAESVIGAGDCFVAFLSMALGHDFTLPEACEIAYRAGAVYVQNRMNRPIVPAELSPSGIVHPSELTNRDFKLVFTNGCFDLLHQGHMETLRFAKSKGDKLVVAVNSDGSVNRLKGKGRPVKTLQQRMAVLSCIKYVDFVVPFYEDTPVEVIRQIKPDVLVKGGDYQINELVGRNLVEEVHVAPLVPGISTTAILHEIQ